MQKLRFIGLSMLLVFACDSNSDNENESSKLIGTWDWVSSCGGFTGGCWYPSAENYESIEFKANMTYIQKSNDLIILESTYAITDTITNGTDVLYTLEFDNGFSSRFRLINDTLSIEGGDFWKVYKKIK